jgi:hypothetical protein
MDETGFRSGVISRRSLVVTRKSVKAAYMANLEDRTLVTSVECVSVDGRVIPLLAILPNKVFYFGFIQIRCQMSIKLLIQTQDITTQS